MRRKLLVGTVGILAWAPMAESAYAQTAKSSPKEGEVEEVVVTALRGQGDPKDLPIKIELIPEEEVRLQQTVATTNTELLSNLIPSFAPSRQKLTGGGETFRGRTPLYLVDGVPQSTPLRPGGREGVTIDLEVIERVEVIFGANAIQGLGGTGGVINYVTVRPQRNDEFQQRISFTGSGNDGLERDSFGWRAHYLAAKDFGDFDLVGAISYEDRGMFYDADDRRIGVDYESGDVQDSHSLNLFFKGGWEFAEGQRLQLMANKFRLDQEADYVRINGDRARGIPAVSVRGTPRGDVPFNDVKTASLDYSNAKFLGGRLSFQAFYQDFKSLFGGQVTASFQDPLIAPIGTLFDQSQNNSEKYGAKLAYSKQEIAGTPLGLVFGVDALRDLTSQPLVVTNRVSVPQTTFYNYAPFIQANLKALDWLTLTAGARQEFGKLKVPDYVTRAGNRSDFRRVPVTGGSRRFDATLLNSGVVLTPFEGFSAYGSYSQAFSVPDIGRVLRSVSTFGTTVNNLIDINPIKTINKEVGGEYRTDRYQMSLSYFESSSKFGQTLVARPDGTFDLSRQAVKTSGWEISAKATPTSWLAIGGGYSHLKGRMDSDANGSLDSDLGAADIGPHRLNLYLDLTPDGPFSARLQSFTYFDKGVHNRLGAVTARFNGYTTVDASVAYKFDPYVASLSVANLLDKQYFTYNAQAATGSNALYYAGRGRTLTLRLGATF